MVRTLLMSMLACGFFFTSCQQPVQLTESQRAAIRDSVAQLNNRYCDEVRANHIDAAVDLLDDSPDFFWVFTPHDTVFSHDAFIASVKAEQKHFRSIDAVWDYTRVEPLTNECAV
jgi:hypothetical protein